MEAEGKGEETKSKSGKVWIFALFIFIFLYNGYIFMNTDGNTHPLVGTLFNMIIALFVFFVIFHKEELKKEKI